MLFREGVTLALMMPGMGLTLGAAAGGGRRLTEAWLRQRPERAKSCVSGQRSSGWTEQRPA